MTLKMGSKTFPAPTADPKDALIAELVAALEKVAKIAWWSTNDHPHGPPSLSDEGRAELLEIARNALAECREA